MEKITIKCSRCENLIKINNPTKGYFDLRKELNCKKCGYKNEPPFISTGLISDSYLIENSLVLTNDEAMVWDE